MIDLINTLQPSLLLPQTTVQTTTATAWLDTQAYNGAAFFVLLGTLGDTLATNKSYEFDVQESNDGSTVSGPASDVNVEYAVNGSYGSGGAANSGAGALLNSGAANAAVGPLKIGYLGNARYIRLNIVVVGTMAVGTACTVVGVLGHPRHAPAGSPQVP